MRRIRIRLFPVLLLFLFLPGVSPVSALVQNASFSTDSTISDYDSYKGYFADISQAGEVWTENTLATRSSTSSQTVGANIDGTQVFGFGEFLATVSVMGSRYQKSDIYNHTSDVVSAMKQPVKLSIPFGDYFMSPTGSIEAVFIGKTRYNVSSTLYEGTPETDGQGFQIYPMAFSDPEKTITNDTIKDSPAFQLKDIKMSLKRWNGDPPYDILEIEIPAAAVPYFVFTLKDQVSGSQSLETNADTVAPIRFVFTGMINPSYIKQGGDPDMSKISGSYRFANASSEAVNFYAERFPQTVLNTGSGENPVGETKVSFEPSEDNGFYRYTENRTVYRRASKTGVVADTSGVLSDPLTSKDGIFPDSLYYTRVEEDTFSGEKLSRQTRIVSLTGKELLKCSTLYDGQTGQEVGDGESGASIFLGTKKGSLRGDLPVTQTRIKNRNSSQTSIYKTVTAPDEEYASVVEYLGNNTRLSADARSLQIRKEKTEGVPDVYYTFRVNAGKLTGTGELPVYAREDTGTWTKTRNTRRVEFNANSIATVTLKQGEGIEIPGLGTGEHYDVEEISIPNGVKPEEYRKSGELEKSTTVSFKNETAKGAFSPRFRINIENESASVNKAVTVRIEKTSGPDGVVLPEPAEAVLYGSGDGNFAPLIFSEDGTYTFKITQDAIGDNFESDTSEWFLTVEVGGGQTTFAATYKTPESGDTETRSDYALFKNRYNRSALEFKARISLHPSGDPHPGDLFSFTMTADDGQNYADKVEYPGELEIGEESFDCQLPKDQAGGKPTYLDPETLPSMTVKIKEPGDYRFKISMDKRSSFAMEATDLVILKLTVKEVEGELTATSVSYEMGWNSGSSVCAFFSATYSTASLTVSKQISGEYEGDQEFDFALELTEEDHPYDADVNVESDNESNGPTIRSGGSFKLGEDEHITFKGLPTGVKYKITETPVPGFTAVRETEEGSISTNTAPVTFINVFDPQGAVFAPRVRKTFKNTVPLTEPAFTFTMTDTEENNKDGYEEPEGRSAIVHGTGTADFPPVTFTEAGEYNFTIREESGDEDGITYSQEEWGLKVTVSGDAVLTAQAEYTLKGGDGEPRSDYALFTNEYRGADLTVSKTVEGAGEDRSFSIAADIKSAGQSIENPFVMEKDGQQSQFISGTPVQLKNGESFTIKDVPVGASYQVTELGLPAGYRCEITPESGTVSGREPVSVEVKNIYDPGKATFKPQVTKAIEGAEPGEASTFTFTIEEEAGNPEGGASFTGAKTAFSEGEGTVSFPDIEFGLAGTYHFDIKEEDSHIPGYTCDGQTVKLTVEAADLLGDGNLGVRSYNYQSEAGTSEAVPVFTNEYRQESVREKLHVIKKEEDVSTDESYSFELSADPQEGLVLPQNTILNIEGDGTGDFDEVSFTRSGSYNLKIRETAGTTPGIVYDETVWEVTAEVTDSASKLSADISYRNGSGSNEIGATFTNSYREGNLTIDNRLAGEGASESDVFTYVADLTGPDGRALEGDFICTGTPGRRFSSGGEIPVTGTASVTIEGIPAGTAYQVRQVRTPDGYTVSLKNEQGKIGGNETVSVTGTNTYSALRTTYTPQIEKIFNSSDRNLDTAEFTFEISKLPGENSASVVLPEETRITGTRGDLQFDPVTFNRAGEYRLGITEVADDRKGMTFDSSAWTLTVTVANRNGSLEVTGHTYSKDGADNAEKATFTNSYAPVNTSVRLSVNNSISSITPYNADFDFVLARTGGQEGSGLLPENATLTVQGAGNGKFDPIVFSHDGIYTYTITGTDMGTPGYIFDTSTWTVTVEVEDNAGELSVRRVTYSKDGAGNTNAAAFSQTYQSGQLALRKTASGGLGESYKFEIDLTDGKGQDLPGTYPGRIGSNSTDISAGSNFTMTDRQTLIITGLPVGAGYSIREIDIPSGYSPSYTDCTGTITAGISNAAVENTYNAQSAVITPQVRKAVNGSPAAQEKFNFTLEPKGNTEGVRTGSRNLSVTGARTGVFEPVSFSKAGTYTFEIKEVPGNTPGYTYDDTVWTLSVRVSESGGALSAVPSYRSNTAQSGSTEAVFTNSYEAEGTSYRPAVSKTVAGNSEETFRFTIAEDRPQDGATLPAGREVSVKGTGKANFDAISFSRAGTYNYTIRETAGSSASMIYDSSVWNLQVAVTDSDGALSVSRASYSKDGVSGRNEASFENKVRTGSLTVSKTVSGAGSDETFELSVSLAGVSGTLRYTGDVSGSINAGSGTIRLKGGQSVVIRDIPYGTVYNIEEINIPQGYVPQYSGCSGTLSGDESASVTNIRKEPDSAGYTPKVRKTVEGNPQTPESFSFALEQDAGNSPQAEMSGTDASVSGNGEADFGTITFRKAGTYLFNITETAGNTPGYAYDNTVWQLKVTVRESGGALSVDSAVYEAQDGSGRSSTAAAEFVNTYSYVPAEITLKASKQIEGSGYEDSTFRFRLSGGAGAEMPAETEKTITTSGGRGETAFDPATVREPGIYNFTISEVVEGAGFIFDSTPKTAAATVEADGNVLKVRGIEYSSGSGSASFVNTYNAGIVQRSPAVRFKTAGKAPENVSYSYAAGLKEGESGNVEISGTPADVDGEIRFGTITFKKAGTYVFELVETESPSGAQQKILYTVTIEEDNGSLSVAEEHYSAESGEPVSGEPSFEHNYPTGSLKIEKRVENGTPGEKFDFTLHLRAGAAPAAQTYDGRIGNTPVAVGADTEFRLGDRESLTIEELPAGLSYRVEEKTPSNYTLETEHESGEITEGGTEVLLTNRRLEETPQSVRFVARAMGMTSGSGEAGDLGFTLSGEGKSLKASSPAGAAASFEALEYTEPGTHSYIISQESGSAKGFSYDNSQWVLTVNVTKNNDRLTASGEYRLGAQSRNDYALFTNSYTPEGVSLKPAFRSQAEEGINPDILLHYSLSCASGDSGLTMPENTTAQARAGEAGEFDPVLFNRAGKFSFTISQTGENITGIRTDPTPWTLDVTVEDTGGALSISGAGYTGGGNTDKSCAVFSNTLPRGGFVLSCFNSGGDAEDRFEYALTFRDYADAGLTGSYALSGLSGKESVRSGETLSLKGGERVSVSGLPEGSTYRVAAVRVPEGYTTASRDEAGQILEGRTPEAVFTHSRGALPSEGTGSLAVSKQIGTGNPDIFRDFEFRITLSDSEGKPLEGFFPWQSPRGTGEIASGDTLMIRHGEEAVISGIPAGSAYTVEETAADGYRTTSSGSAGTVTADAVSKASFTNLKNGENPSGPASAGSLQISKHVTGGDPSTRFSFTLSLSSADGTPLAGEYPMTGSRTGTASDGSALELSDAESVIISGLPGGTRYRVEEAPDPDYTSAGSNDTGTVTAGSVSSASFVNTYKTVRPEPAESGNLRISKTVSGIQTDREFEFTLSLTGDEGLYPASNGESLGNGSVFSLRNGESLEIDGIPAGTAYKVQETPAENFRSEGEATGGTIPSGGTAEASYTNIYEEPSAPAVPAGSVKVRKTVLGKETGESFGFRIILSGGEIPGSVSASLDGTVSSLAVSDDAALFSLKDGQEITIGNIPAGLHYRIEETSSGSFQTYAAGEDGVIEENFTALSSFINDFGEETPDGTGQIMLTKEVSGSDTTRSFTFVLALKDSNGEDLEGEYEYYGSSTGTTGNGGELKLASGDLVIVGGLPVGCSYSITEREADSGGFRTTAAGNTGTVSEGTTRCRYINEAVSAGAPENPDTPSGEEPDEPGTGNLSVSKTVRAENIDPDEKFDFSFVFTGEDGEVLTDSFSCEGAPDGKIASGETLSLGHGETATVSGIPAGTRYRVEEAENENYTATVTAGTGTIAEGQTTPCLFVNTPKSGAGTELSEPHTLVISKKVEGAVSAEAFNFTLTLTGPGGEAVRGSYPCSGTDITSIAPGDSFSLRDGESLTVSGLPDGIRYSVTEEEAEGYTSSVTGPSGTTSAEGNEPVAFVNTKTAGNVSSGPGTTPPASAVTDSPASTGTRQGSVLLSSSGSSGSGTAGSRTAGSGTSGTASETPKTGRGDYASGFAAVAVLGGLGITGALRRRRKTGK